MSTLKKLVVVTMLVALMIAFTIPASAEMVKTDIVNVADQAKEIVKPADIAPANIAPASVAPASGAPLAAGPCVAPSTCGGCALPSAAAWGGYGYPFNWGFVPFGVGTCFPFNYALGAGLPPFGLCWDKFSPCFTCGYWNQFSPCFGCGGCGIGAAPLATGIVSTAVAAVGTYILGTGTSISGFGWQASPWAFGLGGCTKAAPLYFGAHGFGFPFTLGCGNVALMP